MFKISKGVFLLPSQVIELLEIMKVKFTFGKVCYDIFKNPRHDFKPDDTQGDVVFSLRLINVIHGDGAAYMPVTFSQRRSGSLLCGLGSGKYTLNTAVHFPQAVNQMPEDAFESLVIAADEEELSVFYDMCKIIIRGIAHISKIYRRRAAPGCRVDHLTECSVFIAFPARLDHEVRESPVKNRVKGIDMDLIEASG